MTLGILTCCAILSHNTHGLGSVDRVDRDGVDWLRLWVRRVDGVGLRWVRPAHRPGAAVVGVIARAIATSIASSTSLLLDATEASALGLEGSTYSCKGCEGEVV